MIRCLLYLLLMSYMLIAETVLPMFQTIDSVQDFYANSDISIEVQVIDQSKLIDVNLYYRFSNDDSFSYVKMEQNAVSYIGTIPSVEVASGKLEYYFFARDEYGNQSTWPESGDENPLILAVLESSSSDIDDDAISVEMINPRVNEENENVSIIIMSLYDSENSIKASNIRVLLNGQDISESTFKSIDMVTYVPSSVLDPGKHKIEFQLFNEDEVYFKKEFNFSVIESKYRDFNLKEAFKLRASINYNSDYDEFFGKDRPESRPFDIHKINASLKFQIGSFKIRSGFILNQHIFDDIARTNAKRNQPLDRFKFGLSSPFLDMRYGDFSTEFSELTLKGTRIRGSLFKVKLGPWKTNIISGRTKELIKSKTSSSDDDSGIEIVRSLGSCSLPQYICTDNNDDTTTAEEQNNYSNEAECLAVCTDAGFSCEGKHISTASECEIVSGEWTVGDTLYVNHTKGTAPRNISAFRTELDFKKINLGLSALKANDDIDEYNLLYDELNNQYSFLGNAVIGADITVKLNNKKTQFKAETAISLANDLNGLPVDSLGEDVSQDQIDLANNIFGSIEDIVGFNINSDLITGNPEGRGISISLPTDVDNLDPKEFLVDEILKKGTYRLSFKTPIEFKQNTFDVQAEYKRIPSNFMTLGNASIQTDIQGLKTALRGRLLNNKLSIGFTYDKTFDNTNGEDEEKFEDTHEEGDAGYQIYDEGESFIDSNKDGEWNEGTKFKSITTTSISQGYSLGINLPKYPSLNYSFKTMNRDGEEVRYPYSLSISNTTTTHTISPAYKFSTSNNIKVNLGGNIMMMNYNDNLYVSNDGSMTNTNFKTGSYTGSLGLRFDSPLTFNLGLGLSVNTPEASGMKPTEFLVISSKLGYKFLEKKLRTFVGVNIVSGSKEKSNEEDTAIDNTKISIKCGAQYKLSNQINIGFSTNLISLKDKIESDNNYSELKGKFKLTVKF